jgi:hypothetical protein
MKTEFRHAIIAFGAAAMRRHGLLVFSLTALRRSLGINQALCF